MGWNDDEGRGTGVDSVDKEKRTEKAKESFGEWSDSWVVNRELHTACRYVLL